MEEEDNNHNDSMEFDETPTYDDPQNPNRISGSLPIAK